MPWLCQWLTGVSGRVGEASAIATSENVIENGHF